MNIKIIHPTDMKYIVVHCAATTPDMDIGAEDIDRWHRERGWRKIGYHFVIRRDGNTETGRNLGEPGAHVKGYNSNSIGVCLAGGLNDKGEAENNFTPKQEAALFSLVRWLLHVYPNAKLVGHRDLAPGKKECPCFDVQAWYKLQVTRGDSTEDEETNSESENPGASG